MASTVAARRLTEAHRLAQARLGARTVRQMFVLWALLDPADLDATYRRWLRAAVPTVQLQRAASARLAADYLATFRLLEVGTTEGWTATRAGDAPAGRVATSLTVTGPVKVRQALRSLPVGVAMQVAQATSAAAAMRHVLDGGRETVLATARDDELAHGWARVTSGDPCSFCAMLASRGPVYSEDTVDFQAHDSCACTFEVAYRRDAGWPPSAERWRDLWDESTRGLSGQDARNAFRRAVEAA